MFRPLVLIGISEHELDMDNHSISEAVVARKHLRMSDNLNDSLSEDSFFPMKEPECKRLIEVVDSVIQEHVHPDLRTQNQWAHILDPGESTMIHDHGGGLTNSTGPVGISWVYYPEVPKHSGNIAWTFEANAHRMTSEATPEVGKLILFGQDVPHFTKKNNSGKRRISISGNAWFDSVPNNFDPGALLNYTGLFRG